MASFESRSEGVIKAPLEQVVNAVAIVLATWVPGCEVVSDTVKNDVRSIRFAAIDPPGDKPGKYRLELQLRHIEPASAEIAAATRTVATPGFAIQRNLVDPSGGTAKTTFTMTAIGAKATSIITDSIVKMRRNDVVTPESWNATMEQLFADLNTRFKQAAKQAPAAPEASLAG